MYLHRWKMLYRRAKILHFRLSCRRRLYGEKELYETMSTVIKQHKENGIYVVMEWEKSNIYRVASYICYHDGRCGYPIKEMTYSINEKKKAEATFRRYVKKYCKGE